MLKTLEFNVSGLEIISDIVIYSKMKTGDKEIENSISQSLKDNIKLESDMEKL